MTTWESRESLLAQTDPDAPRSRAAPQRPPALPPLALDDAPYIELHLHSCFSMLNGASHIQELAASAQRLGYPALALTDDNGLHGAMEFAQECKRLGVRPITGVELTVADDPMRREADAKRERGATRDAKRDVEQQRGGANTHRGTKEKPRSHLTLLAESRAGYRNLCRLLSFAHGLLLDGAKEKEERRKDPWIDQDTLVAHTEGLIALSGCRQGRVPALVAEGKTAEAEAALRQLVSWFGRDNVFVELQDNRVYGDAPRNRALVQLAERVGVGVVGTGNVHYHDRARHRLQDVLTATRHRKTLEESHRERLPNDEYFLRAPQEQAERFTRYHPEAARNSVRIAQRCRFDLTADLGYRLPEPKSNAKRERGAIANAKRREAGARSNSKREATAQRGATKTDGDSTDTRLRRVCETRLRQLYPRPDHDKATKRLEQELALIQRHGLSGFFLIYHELFELAEEVAREVRGEKSARARARLPVGRGRGSSVSSIVCYLIGLSHIDPLRDNLFLGRFLNESLDTLPDIDLDFPRDIRERLIERVYEHWGRDHAALVASFPTYRMRSAVRDVGKALGLPLAELNRLARLAGPYQSAADLREQFLRYPEFAARVDAPIWRDFIQLVPQLSGMPRHMSEHVGGMVIASEPLIDCVPCHPAAWEGRYVCQWDKDSINDARMVKIDFLALGMLSAVEEVIELIDAEHGRTIDFARIDYKDQAVYDDVCNGDTVGVFQIESRAQIAMLPRSQPRNLEDLAVQVAIVRPGPIVGGAVNPYVKRRVLRRENPGYVPPMPHPGLSEVLKETLGVVIFQEQVLQVAEIMGGFSAGEAEAFRRAMSRKRSEAIMESYRERFLEGARARGVALPVATRVFDNLKGFAEFGFPKSHAVSFGLLAYQTAWLKHYYPAEFYCALFNNQPMGFYPPHVLTNDAKRHDVGIVRPAINRSAVACTLEHDYQPGPAPPIGNRPGDEAGDRGSVRVGLGYVRHVGAAGAATITRERARDGDFRSLFDFVQRTGLARRATESLIQIGAFDALGLNRRELIWQLGLLGDGMTRSRLRLPMQRQLRLALPTEQDAVALPDFSAYQRMAADYALLGLSPDSHPLSFLRPALGEGVASSLQLRTLGQGVRVTVAGLVVCRQRPLTAKGIVFLLLEDEYGLVNVLVNREMDESQTVLVRTALFLEVDGILEKRAGEQRTLVATALREVVPAQALTAPPGKSWG